jgi:subtilisin-like proprotein convertase family protein
LAIPDDDPTGVTDTLTIAEAGSIIDLNLRLQITHTWVGDLIATLTHVDTGTTAVLFDQPGVPASINGCGNDNVQCTLDDEAANPVEDECAGGTAIGGSLRSDQLLSRFEGESYAGMWRLRISDNAGVDTGSLVQWCLEVNSTVPVVTAFTCAGNSACVVETGDPWSLSFSFVDPNANAVSWHLDARRDDGMTFPNLATGQISPPSGSGTVVVPFNPFAACPNPPCSTAEFDFFATVRDADGQDSGTARVLVTVPGS